jgi:diguanylate cyclase (GGDEF)-like protein
MMLGRPEQLEPAGREAPRVRFNGFKRSSIVVRIGLAGCLSLLLFAVAMLIFIKNDLEQTIYSETDARVVAAQKTMLALIRAKGAPTLAGRELRLGSWIANDDNSLVDEVRELTGADATLFAVYDGTPIRVSTTILKLDGSGRNVHTELLGPARTAIDEGRPFAGVSPVAGRPFLDRYEQLRDGRGRVVGIAYTGIPLTLMNQTVAQAMRIVLAVTVVALGASLGLLFVVIRPLQRVFRDAVTMAQGLAGGDVEQVIGRESDDELGQVSQAFREMIAYQQRMASVADALASGDFSREVIPASPRDRLGVAFAHMSENLDRLVRQLELSAMTDSLTQLGNRRAFDVRIQSEISRAARHGGHVWLALVDVDNFKQANDEHGHQHGDLVLLKLATVLRSLRAEDGAYRLGGDEFAVVLPDCSQDDAKRVLERMRDEAQSKLFGTTISAGLASSPHGLTDAETLLRQADAALYVCKQRGRNIVLAFRDIQDHVEFPHSINVRPVRRMIAEGTMPVAFQPIWDFERGAILGFEALARPDPKYGIAGAQEAFDVAAKIGRSHDLDHLCREAAIAQAEGLPASALLFLNISPETLARDANLTQALSAKLSEVGISVDRVVLEITERYAGAIEPVLATARELQRFGFKLALDDTGAGNAGLEYLSRLKVDFIKIDGAIVANAKHDVSARGVIAAIVALAKTTHAYVIAEGIEDRGMLDSVRPAKLGEVASPTAVSGVQGYYVGRPGLIRDAMDAADETARLLRAGPATFPAGLM